MLYSLMKGILMKYMIRLLQQCFLYLAINFMVFGPVLRPDSSPSAAVNNWNVQNGEKVTNYTYNSNLNPGTHAIFNGTVTFDGDILFVAESNQVLPIDIGTTTSGSNGVIFKPLLGTTTNPKYAHLIFSPDVNGQIYVRLFSDLRVTGSNMDLSTQNVADTNVYVNSEMTISFRGKAPTSPSTTQQHSGSGQTVFSLANGKKLVFTTMIEDKVSHNIVPTNAPGYVGVKVLVAMDQSRNEVVNQGVNKVVFQRDNYLTGPNDCSVEIGYNSFLTFVSVNYTGYDSTTNPTYSDILPNDNGTNIESYAAIAFDVSNKQGGRMILNINGGPQPNSFVDGSFMMVGNFLRNSTSGDTPGFYTSNNDLRNHVDFSQVAGCQAFMRVIDNVAYNQDLQYQDALNPGSGGLPGVVAGVPTRRGLLIQSQNSSFRSFASNTYGDQGWFYQQIFNAGNGRYPVRHGFVLGVNGVIDVGHNLFVEYEADIANQLFDPNAIGLSTLYNSLVSANISSPNLVFKTHNPSAMLVDGLGPVLVNVATPPAAPNYVDQIKYVAHEDPTIIRRAEIDLRGNASINFHGMLLPTDGVFDGFRLPAAGETLGDGVQVLDMEGGLVVRSLDDNFVPSNPATTNPLGMHPGSMYSKAGVFRLASLWRSYDDREILDLSGVSSSYVQRPLLVGNSYKRYDRASILTNATFDFIDMIYDHQDVSRSIVISNILNSPPEIMGGEQAHFLNTVLGVANPDLSFWRIYNTQIQCHTSMCISGVRLVLRELPDYQSLLNIPTPLANQSSITMYNHGLSLDTLITGHGRVFLMGTALNEVAAGGTSDFLQNAYMNVFRDTGSSLTAGSSAINLPVTLSLTTEPEVPQGVSTNEKATQVFYMANGSNVEIGWSSPVGIYQDDNGITVYPWDHLDPASVTNASNKFTLDSNVEVPATLSFAGDFIYLGGEGPNGVGSPTEITGYGLGRVIYMGHGSNIQIVNEPITNRPYFGSSDATIAVRTWISSVPGLSAQIHLPREQFFLKNPIRAFGLNMSSLTAPGANAFLHLSALTGGGLGTQAAIAWNQILRPSGSLINLSYLSDDNWSPYSKSPELVQNPDLLTWPELTRAFQRSTGPTTMPTQGLLQVTTGDYLDQLSVSGASLADPFVLYMTGDLNGISQIREIVSEASEILSPGEGSFARIFMDQGARLGLGSRELNANSANAWNLLGKNFVALIPNGDCQIDVNSNLIVYDPQPIIPTQNFGSSYINSGGFTVNPAHRITFYAHDTKEVRVPAGKELDLSAFGQATTTISGSQQIAISGSVRLIFEPGSTLRFPNLVGAGVAARPVLYLNENSELIFEAIQDMNNKAVGSSSSVKWATQADSTRARIRIVGVGDIWLNKNAVMRINDNSLVSVESDVNTPNTQLTISMQRDSQLLLGGTNNQGGTFQVGNPLFNADGSPYVVPGASINFVLRMASPTCKCVMGRNSLMAFGAAAVDRFSSSINNWTVQPLQDVDSINLRLYQGTFDHSRIYAGNSAESSLMIIGPLNAGAQYKIELGISNMNLRGGGNLMYLTRSSTTVNTDVTTPNILSTASLVTSNLNSENGKYSLLSSFPILHQTTALSSPDAGSALITTPTESGQAIVGFQGSPKDAFNYLAFTPINLQQPVTYADLGINEGVSIIGFVDNNNNIVRLSAFTLEGGITNNQVLGVTNGVLKRATSNNTSANLVLTLPQ